MIPSASRAASIASSSVRACDTTTSQPARSRISRSPTSPKPPQGEITTTFGLRTSTWPFVVLLAVADATICRFSFTSFTGYGCFLLIPATRDVRDVMPSRAPVSLSGAVIPEWMLVVHVVEAGGVRGDAIEKEANEPICRGCQQRLAERR